MASPTRLREAIMPKDSSLRAVKSMETRGGLSTRSKAFELALGRALDALPYGAYREFAIAFGRSDTWVGRLRDPGDSIHVDASDLPRALAAVRTVRPLNELLAQWRIAGKRWHVVPAPEVAPSGNVQLDTMALAGSAGGFVAAVGQALEDDHLSRIERAELRELLTAHREQVEALIAGLG